MLGDAPGTDQAPGDPLPAGDAAAEPVVAAAAGHSVPADDVVAAAPALATLPLATAEVGDAQVDALEAAAGLLVDGLADVPAARHHVARRLREAGDEELVDLAELVVTELVTNALLHGRAPISVTLARRPGFARLEVRDGNPALPESGQSADDEMTGRGLALVEALASRWGAVPTTSGKVVWCELVDAERAAEPVPTELPVVQDAEPRAPGDLPRQRDVTTAPEGREICELSDVPVDLLLAAEAHVDDLVRDLVLAGSGPDGPRDDAVPAVAARVAAAAEGVAEQRRLQKRLGAEARAAGADTVTLPRPTGPDVVDAEQEYLAALDEADSYCRAVRLLTLEAPPQHRILRRWMADQVAAASSPGAEPAVAVLEPFRDRLLRELAGLAAVRRAAARAARLQQVATGLSRARTPEQVSEVVLEQGCAALGAARGALLRVEGGQVRLAGAVGLAASAVARAERVRLTDRLPSTDALRDREPVWVESLAERDRRYPELAVADPESHAVVAAPLVAGDRPLGVLRFGFDHDLVVDDDERGFVRALAATAASALERSLSDAAERTARRQAETTASRLRRLQQVTAAVAGAREEAEVADVVLGHAAEAIGARIGTICLLERPGALASLDPDAVVEMRYRLGVDPAGLRWRRFRMSDPVPVAEAIRTDRPIVLPTVADRDRRFPALATGLSAEEHAVVVLPLSVGERRLGALTLSFFDSARLTEPGAAPTDPRRVGPELAFLGSLADVCTQALDRLAAVRSLRSATERFAFLAQASVELASSLDYNRTLRRVAELAVPVVADWCTVAVAEDGVLRTFALAHSDPRKVESAQQLERAYPPDPATSAAYRVLATGRSEIYPVVTDEQIDASASDDEHRRLLRAIGPLRSVMLVPLPARGRVLGVLTLVSAAEVRPFGPDDLALAEDLARRAALAVDTARLFRDARAR